MLEILVGIFQGFVSSTLYTYLAESLTLSKDIFYFKCCFDLRFDVWVIHLTTMGQISVTCSKMGWYFNFVFILQWTTLQTNTWFNLFLHVICNKTLTGRDIFKLVNGDYSTWNSLTSSVFPAHHYYYNSLTWPRS